MYAIFSVWVCLQYKIERYSNPSPQKSQGKDGFTSSARIYV